MSFCSDQWLKDFRFHDSEWMLEFVNGNDLIFSAERVNIRGGAEQNSADCDMELEMAQITLSGFTLREFAAYDAREEMGEAWENMAALMCRGFRVLSLTAEADGQHHMSLCTADIPFCEMRFSFDGALVEWDGLARPAWYVNHKM